MTLETLCHGLQTLWVGRPHKLRRADIKALQLAEASKAGLKTLRTLISSGFFDCLKPLKKIGQMAYIILATWRMDRALLFSYAVAVIAL